MTVPPWQVLTYYGTQKERKEKRKGWNKPNNFHVCITSYKLVIQDAVTFKRKKAPLSSPCLPSPPTAPVPC